MVFFIVAKDNIENILKSYSEKNYKINYLNFWQNFSCSFRDVGFVNLVKNNQLANSKLVTIIKLIISFFEDNLSTQIKFSLKISMNLKIYSEVFSRILDFYLNLQHHKFQFEDIDLQLFDIYFKNFQRFSEPNTDLFEIRRLIFEKPGLAYLDYKGNFSKF
jgi:hypothetical protein